MLSDLSSHDSEQVHLMLLDRTSRRPDANQEPAENPHLRTAKVRARHCHLTHRDVALHD